jgi:hypothetical protein
MPDPKVEHHLNEGAIGVNSLFLGWRGGFFRFLFSFSLLIGCS